MTELVQVGPTDWVAPGSVTSVIWDSHRGCPLVFLEDGRFVEAGRFSDALTTPDANVAACANAITLAEAAS